MTDPDQKTSRIEVFDDPEDNAYVITIDGRRAGKTVYHIRGGRYFFVHTEIEADFEGGGLGRELVRYALDDVRAKGASVVPICPFVRGYTKRHPEYDDLLDHEILARIERSAAKRESEDLGLK